MTLQDKVKNYIPSPVAKEIVKKCQIVLLVGPIGVGKTELKNRLLGSDKFHHIISHTTRAPRYNHGILEVDGGEYHFIDLKRADELLDNKEFIEAKYINGNIYGTSINEIKKAIEENKIAITDIDVQGVDEYKAIDKNVKAFFLLPPDFKTWQYRIEKRHGDEVKVEDYAERLKIALSELNELLNTSNYIAVINNDFEETLKTITNYLFNKNIKIDDSSARKLAKSLKLDTEEYLTKILKTVS
jgi:guanylate kinase